MSLLDDGASWLLAQTQAAAGKSATYIRGSSRTSVTVVRRSRGERIDDGNGIPVVVRRHSIVIASAELEHEPRPGDRIEETVAGSLVTWEVLPPEDGEPCFRWWNREQTAYVIHVTQVGA